MGLNREQIIKAIEHCFSDRPCSKCEWHEVGNGCLSKLEQTAISLIKELTEENERLKRTQVVQHIHIDEQFRKECEYEMKQLKADTVKKMQERLTSFFANDDTLKYIEVDAEYINEQIDHITEEILEEVTANGDKED